MTIQEKIQEYQNKIERLNTQKQTIGTAVDLKWGEATCPYCGKARVPIQSSRAMAERFGASYRVCECEEAQEALKQAKEITFALQDMDRETENCEMMIENLKRTSSKMLKESLGRRFADRTFKTFRRNEENGRAFDTCYAYAMNFKKNEEGKGLLLCGNPGTGKTHLAAAITHKIIEDYGIPVEFKTAIEMQGELTSFERETYDRYKKCDLLIIDDLGKEKSTEWRKEKLFEIINARYEDYLPTIITTNTPANRFTEFFGEAFASRLMEISLLVPVTGKNWRTK